MRNNKLAVCLMLAGLTNAVSAAPIKAVTADSATRVPTQSALEESTLPQTWVWDKNPIPLVLPVGGERKITFPAPVEFQAPTEAVDSVKPDSLGDGTLFLHALKPFKTARFRATTETGTVYFLDISAVPNGSTQALTIVDPVAREKSAATVTEAEKQAAFALPPPPSVGVDQVVQAAFRCVYGPARFCVSPTGVNRVALKSAAVRLYETGELRAQPIAAWRASTDQGDRFATLVQMTNQAQQVVILDPRRLNGRFTAAAMLFARVAPGRDTFVVIVSDLPFDQAVPATVHAGVEHD